MPYRTNRLTQPYWAFRLRLCRRSRALFPGTKGHDRREVICMFALGRAVLRQARIVDAHGFTLIDDLSVRKTLRYDQAACAELVEGGLHGARGIDIALSRQPPSHDSFETVGGVRMRVEVATDRTGDFAKSLVGCAVNHVGSFEFDAVVCNPQASTIRELSG